MIEENMGQAYRHTEQKCISSNKQHKRNEEVVI